MKSFREIYQESIGGAFLPTNSMGTPETMPAAELITPIERVPVPIEDGGRKVIVTGKKKTSKQLKSFKECLNEMIASEIIHNNISVPHLGSLVKNVGEMRFSIVDDKLNAGAARNFDHFSLSAHTSPHGVIDGHLTYRDGKFYIHTFDRKTQKRWGGSHPILTQIREKFKPKKYDPYLRTFDEETNNIDEGIYDNIVAAGRVGSKIYIAPKGKTHGWLLMHGDNGKMIGGGDKGFNGVEWGFWHNRRKEFKTRHELGDLETTDLMTPLQRFKRYGTEETLYEMRNLYDTVKFKNSSPERQKLLRRVMPAIQDRATKKLYVGKRGDWHPRIAQNYGLEDYSYQDTTMAKGKYQRGFLDPLKKKFITAWKMGMDAAELPMDKIARMRMYGEEIFVDPGVLQSRIIPAIKVGEKIFMGRRGMIHRDIADRHNIPHSYQPGFIDPRRKKFYQNSEPHWPDYLDIDSTDLMTRSQRAIRFGNEEFKSFGAFLNESATAQFHDEYTGILKNPSYRQLVTQHAHSDNEHSRTFVTKKALRYVYHPKSQTVWTADANQMVHDDIAKEAGIDTHKENWYKHTRMGFIAQKHLPAIQKAGLRNWIQAQHKKYRAYYISDPDMFEIGGD